MHKSHLTGCVVGILLALAVVRLTGGSAGGLGVLVAALICPVMMLVMMRSMMGGHAERNEHAPTEGREDARFTDERR